MVFLLYQLQELMAALKKRTYRGNYLLDVDQGEEQDLESLKHLETDLSNASCLICIHATV